MKKLTKAAKIICRKIASDSYNTLLANESVVKDIIQAINDLERGADESQEKAKEIIREKLADIGAREISQEQAISLIDQEEEILLSKIAFFINQFKDLSNQWDKLCENDEIFEK